MKKYLYLSLLLAGCGSDVTITPPTASETKPVLNAETTRIDKRSEVISTFVSLADTTEDMPFNDMLMQGTLLIENQCVYVVLGGKKFIPTFSNQTTEWNETEQLLVSNGKSYTSGDDVAFGGSASEFSTELKPSENIPKRCLNGAAGIMAVAPNR